MPKNASKANAVLQLKEMEYKILKINDLLLF